MPTALSLALALPVLFTSSTGDEPEWGGFRGNNGAGQATSTALPESLDKDENLKWRTELPPGYSSPTVCGELVFITGAEEGILSTIAIEAARSRG